MQRGYGTRNSVPTGRVARETVRNDGTITHPVRLLLPYRRRRSRRRPSGCSIDARLRSSFDPHSRLSGRPKRYHIQIAIIPETMNTHDVEISANIFNLIRYLKQSFRLRIQCACRLIKNQNGRVGEDCSCNGDSLLLPTTQRDASISKECVETLNIFEDLALILPKIWH